MRFTMTAIDNRCINRCPTEDATVTGEWKRSPSYCNSYEDEWCRLFLCDNGLGTTALTDAVRSLALTGQLRNCRFRSVCWRVYLGLLGTDAAVWTDEADKHRKEYRRLREAFIIDPRTDTGRTDDPLSVNVDSRWNQYFRGQQLMNEIRQDVVRTFPEIEFFHGSAVRAAMINVLYCYARTSSLSYRQGMHELLAPIVFVLHCDHLAYEHSCELGQLSERMQHAAGTLLDRLFLEHDAYAMFSQIMGTIEPWYDSGQSGTGTNSICRYEPRPFDRNNHKLYHQQQTNECALGRKVNAIHNNILKRQDLDVYMHLESLEISPQMFGFRWLKLLFGREFTMQDLLMVWDVLLAVGDGFALADALYVSMVVHIRHLLLASDFTGCLTQLMRYPKDVDVGQIIDHALHLFDPSRFSRPADISQYRGGGAQPVPAAISYRQRRAQRNKTIVGIEQLTSRLGSLISRKAAAGNQQHHDRPAHLPQSPYRGPIPSISDSAPVTPTNKPRDGPGGVIDMTEYLEVTVHQEQHDGQQVAAVCAGLVGRALVAIRGHVARTSSSAELDQAMSALIQARDVLSSSLTLNRRTLITALQNVPAPATVGKGLNRSVSSNDVVHLIGGGTENGVTRSRKPSSSGGGDLFKFLPLSGSPGAVGKPVELHDITSSCVNSNCGHRNNSSSQRVPTNDGNDADY